MGKLKYIIVLTRIPYIQIKKRPFSLRTFVFIADNSSPVYNTSIHKGVIHRELKPENIGVIQASHQLYLRDFGLSGIFSTPADGSHVPAEKEM